MTTTPLPPLPEVGYLGDDASYGYDANDMTEYATQARADLEAEVQRFRDHLTKQNAELDELIPMAQKLEAENKRLREALQAIVQSWDNNTFCRERFVKSELGDYWAPTSAMVNSETIAAARAALENKP